MNPSPKRRRGPLRRAAGAVVVLGVLAGGALAGCGGDPGQPRTEVVAGSETATFEYVIPAGAGEALDAGTPLEILPAELQVNVGDTIRIENQDDRGHTVGPFFVGANETLTQRFSTPGEFEGVCTVHPSGQFVLVVNA
jgi:plastocyanin